MKSIKAHSFTLLSLLSMSSVGSASTLGTPFDDFFFFTGDIQAVDSTIITGTGIEVPVFGELNVSNGNFDGLGGDGDILSLTSFGGFLPAGDAVNIEFLFAGNGPDVLDLSDQSSGVVAISGAGNDIIATGAGDDIVDGSLGDDFIDTGAGNDDARGNTGNDTIVFSEGFDFITGGVDFDTFLFPESVTLADLTFSVISDPDFSFGTIDSSTSGFEGPQTFVVVFDGESPFG